MKIGACRWGNLCSRLHPQPTTSRTVLFKNILESDADKQKVLDFLYELRKFGAIEVPHVGFATNDTGNLPL